MWDRKQPGRAQKSKKAANSGVTSSIQAPTLPRPKGWLWCIFWALSQSAVMVSVEGWRQRTRQQSMRDGRMGGRSPSTLDWAFRTRGLASAGPRHGKREGRRSPPAEPLGGRSTGWALGGGCSPPAELWGLSGRRCPVGAGPGQRSMNGWLLSWFACQRKLFPSITNAVVKPHHHRAAYNLLQKVTWSLLLTHHWVCFGWTKIPCSRLRSRTRLSTFVWELPEPVKDLHIVGRRNFTTLTSKWAIE